MYEIKILSMFILMWAWLRDFVVSSLEDTYNMLYEQ